MRKPKLQIFRLSMFMNSFSTIFFRHVSTATTTKLLNSSKIPRRYQKLAVCEAQKVLTNYLHETQCLPFVYADQIGKNSLLSLANLIVKVDFSASTFSENFEKYLRYHPINEFEFFFESIGIDYNGVSGLLPANKIFFSEDGSILDAAFALSGFGFPWDKLGKLYKGSSSIFQRSPKELESTLCEFKNYGFGNIEVVGICLAFPYILSEEGKEVDGEIDGLFTDLKSVFLDFGLARSVEGNVDSWHEVCRKIRVFYNLNGEKGKLGKLMGRAKDIFIEHGEEELIQKAEYFCRFGVKKEEVALLLLNASELLNLDVQVSVISVLRLLKYFGLSPKNLEDIRKKYDYVLGTNKMANLPNVMRALDLHEWFFNKMKHGNHQLLISYLANHPNEDQDKEYRAGLGMICALRSRDHRMSKLNFLHGLGFGENALTMSVAACLHGYRSELEERFEYLLHLGFKFSKLCMMVKKAPKILNQKSEIIDEKVNFFCQEVGIPLQCLTPMAAVLYYNLENRIKPRYRFYMWLKEKGLLGKNYSIISVIASSHYDFVAIAFKIHPAAPKHWFEQFYITANT